ncbi:MAG: glycosyltransferase family 4 protein [Deltaproteobacteria bacterium]|nr:glycosyltransferase family 4 protein [Deltaproteobacteria bacterium]
MRIAQVAPLFESVPPTRYGGTERVVSYLTEELANRGHDVTLFASGDSITKARLVAGCPMALRQAGKTRDSTSLHLVMLEQVYRQAAAFDVMHFHVDYIHFPVSRRLERAHVTTLHGRLDLPELVGVYREFREMPLVSISDDQRRPLPAQDWRATVHHGLPDGLLRFQPQAGSYLAFLGRISPEKRVDRAIEIARRVGMPLEIGAKIDAADRDYFDARIAHLLRAPGVDFLGEISDREKEELLGGAAVLLFPIDWPEPFGLVMIEAMACGTPIVAWRRGSVPEVIDEGVTGFTVESVDEAVRATREALTLDRRRVREAFERRFSVQRMAEQYLDVYRGLMNGSAAQPPMADDRREWP